MLHWALFVAYENNKAQNNFLCSKLFKNDFTTVAEIKLDCSYDRTLSISLIELAYINLLLRYAIFKIREFY